MSGDVSKPASHDLANGETGDFSFAYQGLLNITAQRVAELRRRVEELISLPEYYAVEAATTEKGNVAPTEHH